MRIKGKFIAILLGGLFFLVSCDIKNSNTSNVDNTTTVNSNTLNVNKPLVSNSNIIDSNTNNSSTVKSIEGIWNGRVLSKKTGETNEWEISLSKIADDYSGRLETPKSNRLDGLSDGAYLINITVVEKEISFLLRWQNHPTSDDELCKGSFSENNSKWIGKCTMNVDSKNNESNKDITSVFELTKK